MYRQDLSVLKKEGDITLLNVGWLALSVEFPQNFEKNQHRLNLTKKLFYCAKYANINRAKGHHVCEFCHFDDNANAYNWGMIGNGEIAIRDRKNENIIYVAPTMICHYVDVHG